VSSEHGSLPTGRPNDGLFSGSLEVRLKLDAKNSKIWLFVIKATLEMSEQLPKHSLVQVHLTVLPSKRVRFRTRAKPIDNAMFAEEFLCKVSPGECRTFPFNIDMCRFVCLRHDSQARHSFPFVHKRTIQTRETSCRSDARVRHGQSRRRHVQNRAVRTRLRMLPTRSTSRIVRVLVVLF
jgi:ubiquitin